MTMVEVGRVAAIRRHPVKSMRGEEIETASLGWNGLDGDRQYAFYRASDGSRFPWLTGRDVAELVLYEARYVEPSNPRSSTVRVRAPDGAAFDLRDAALCERLGRAARRDLRLLQLGRGTFDSMPVSLATQATLDRLGERFGRPLEAARFRLNIVLDSALSEAEWLGRTLVFGDGGTAAKLRVNRAIPRCRMITIDPLTAATDPAILRMVQDEFGNEAGVYGAPEATGLLRRGDRVRLVV